MGPSDPEADDIPMCHCASLSLSDSTVLNTREAGNMNLDNEKYRAFIRIKTF